MTNAEMRSALDSAISRRDNAATVRERRAADEEARKLQRELQTQQIAATERLARMRGGGGGGGGGSNSADNFERDVMEEFRVLKNVAPTGGIRAGDAELMQRARQRVAQRRDLISRANVGYLQGRAAPETEEPDVNTVVRERLGRPPVGNNTPAAFNNWGQTTIVPRG
jgi:hypothetical protein